VGWARPPKTCDHKNITSSSQKNFTGATGKPCFIAAKISCTVYAVVQAGIGKDSIGDTSREILQKLQKHSDDKDGLGAYLMQ
jgi:hypothetical protein